MGAYGISLDTLSPFFVRLEDDTAILRQWVDLQLRTRLGFYWSAPEVGCDLQGYVLRGLTLDALAAIPAQVQASLATDQRIASVEVTAKQTFTGVGAVALSLAIVVTPKNLNLAPFSLTAIASADVVTIVTRGLGTT